jgi:hypothetical protein
LVGLLDFQRIRKGEFRTGQVQTIKKESSVPLIASNKSHNGCAGYLDYSVENEPQEKNCLSVSSFGNFFYQPIPFYAYEGMFALKSSDLNEKRGLFISTVLRTLHTYNYAQRLNERNLKELRVKLPVKENKEPD